MAAVVIGVDPAKRSHTIEAIDSQERVLAAARFDNSSTGYRQLRALARRWPDRVWAVEGATGVGLNLAQRLVADGERVVDVPAKLSTRARAIDTGHGRKNDPSDAHAVAVVGLRTAGLREVVADDQMVAMRLLSERRRDLVRSRTQAVNRLHQVLMELIPAGAGQHLTATKAKEAIAKVRPRDSAGKARRQLAVDLIDDVTVFDRKIKAVDDRIVEAVAASGTRLTEIVGVGPVTAATILGEVGDVARFANADRFASYTGTAPLEASSGDVVRHRLSRAGNRRLNSALHVVALSNKRYDPAAAPTTSASSPPARARRALCAASSDDSQTSSSASWSRTGQQRTREGRWGRHSQPARLTRSPRPTLRTSHNPGSPARLRPP